MLGKVSPASLNSGCGMQSIADRFSRHPDASFRLAHLMELSMFPTSPRAHLNKPIRGLSAYDEVMVEELRLNGVNVQHVLTTIRTDMKASPATRSVAVKLRFNENIDVDINILEVWIGSTPFHSGSIMNPFLDQTRPSKVMHSCGFLIGEDSTLEEVFSSLIDELEFRFKEV